jgi:hypothetical protein
MYELKNPDHSKTKEERDAIRAKGDFSFWWKVEHQYPYILPANRVKRVWCNPFYLKYWSRYWNIYALKNCEKEGQKI